MSSGANLSTPAGGGGGVTLLAGPAQALRRLGVRARRRARALPGWLALAVGRAGLLAQRQLARLLARLPLCGRSLTRASTWLAGPYPLSCPFLPDVVPLRRDGLYLPNVRQDR